MAARAVITDQSQSHGEGQGRQREPRGCVSAPPGGAAEAGAIKRQKIDTMKTMAAALARRHGPHSSPLSAARWRIIFAPLFSSRHGFLKLGRSGPPASCDVMSEWSRSTTRDVKTNLRYHKLLDLRVAHAGLDMNFFCSLARGTSEQYTVLHV